MKRLNLNKDNMVIGTVELIGFLFLIIGVLIKKPYVDKLFLGAGISLMSFIVLDLITKFISNKINV
jgi:hypothetical protein